MQAFSLRSLQSDFMLNTPINCSSVLWSLYSINNLRPTVANIVVMA